MLFSILTSCIQQESQLEQAISQSGDNHIELEKVFNALLQLLHAVAL